MLPKTLGLYSIISSLGNMSTLKAAVEALSAAGSSAVGFSQENKTAVAIAGGLTGLAAVAYFYNRSRYQKKPSTFELSSGSIERSKFHDSVRMTYKVVRCIVRMPQSACVPGHLKSYSVL